MENTYKKGTELSALHLNIVINHLFDKGFRDIDIDYIESRKRSDNYIDFCYCKDGTYINSLEF